MTIRSFGIYVATAQRAAPAQPAFYEQPLLAGLRLTHSSLRRSDAQQAARTKPPAPAHPVCDGGPPET